jgi:hypothetical protein
MDMARKAQESVIDADKLYLIRSFSLASKGQWMAFIIVMTSFILGFLLILFDHEIIGSAFSGASFLTGILSYFIPRSKKSQ